MRVNDFDKYYLVFILVPYTFIKPIGYGFKSTLLIYLSIITF